MICEICKYELRESITRGEYCPNLACGEYVKNCADRIDESMKSREAQIKALLNDPNSDENNDPALSIDTRKVTIVCLSWGGPADYLEITHKGLDIIQVIYRFSDWFDSATREVYEGSPLYTYAQFILECEGSNYEAQ